MNWPNLAAISAALAVPPNIRARQIARSDIDDVIAFLGASHRQLAVGDAAELLTAAFYEDEVALAEEAAAIDARPSYVLLLASSARLVGCLVLEYEIAEEALFGRLVVVAPAFRGRGLGRALLDAEERIGRVLRANVTYGFVALDNRALCGVLARTGRVLCGILPNSDRSLVAPSRVRYVPRAIYAKLLVTPERLQWPARDALRPATAAMMKLLFDGAAPDPRARIRPVPAPPPALDAELAARVADRPAGTWPDVELLARALTLPAGVALRQLARDDIPALIARLPIWYPNVASGFQQRLLTPSFYDELVALAGEDRSIKRRPIHARVFHYRGELIGFHYSICELKRSTLRAEFIAVDPQHRGLGLGLALLPLKVLLGRAIEVDTVVTMATLDTPYRQIAAERSGFQLAGILPAAGVQTGAGAKHAFEALYALSLVSPEDSYRPPSAELAPGVAALADLVLGA